MDPRSQKLFYWGMAVFLGGFSLFCQLSFLTQPFMEVNDWRQNQTAQTIRDFITYGISWFDYRSPADPNLWSFVYEFPYFQALASVVYRAFPNIEVATRLTALLHFWGCATFLYLLSKAFFSRRVAAWAILIFVSIPFSFTFSRAAFIDFSALFYSLASIYCWKRALDSENQGRWYLLLFLTGSLAGMIKSTVWLGPFLLISLVWHWKYLVKIPASLKKLLTEPPFLKMGFWALFLQGVMVLLWSSHAAHIRSLSEFHQGAFGWLIGTFSDRLNLTYWEMAVDTLNNEILLKVLWVPLILGIYSLTKQKKTLASVVGLCVLPLFIFFHVYMKHSYYWMTQLPFIVLLIALGIDWIVKQPRRVSAVLSVLLVIGICFKVYRSYPAYYATLSQTYRPTLEKIRALSDVTDSRDKILVSTLFIEKQYESESRVFSPMAWRLYSDRKLSMGGFENRSLSLSSYSALLVGDNPAHCLDLREVSHLWVDGSPQKILYYRFENAPSFKWNPENKIGVFNKVSPFSTQTISAVPTNLDFCNNVPGSYEVFNLPKTEVGCVEVVAKKIQKRFVLPSLGSISIPSHSELGCRYAVNFIPKNQIMLSGEKL